MQSKPFKDYLYATHKQDDLLSYIRSVGHFNLIEPERHSWHKNASFHELFWCIDGSGYFELNNKKYMVRPGDIWYYPAGSDHYFYPAKQNFHYRWLTIEGLTASSLFETVGLPFGVSFAGKCPEELFAKLELLINQSTKDKRLELLACGFEIITKAAIGGKRKTIKSNYVNEAKDMLDENFGNSKFNIKILANILHVNRVQLSRDFAKQFGVTISGYLQNLRLQKGLALLKNSQLSIMEIAKLCGYSSSDYFGKVILEATGKKASLYRKENSFESK
jgi:AraC-like DNA-binding protein